MTLIFNSGHALLDGEYKWIEPFRRFKSTPGKAGLFKMCHPRVFSQDRNLSELVGQGRRRRREPVVSQRHFQCRVFAACERLQDGCIASHQLT